MYNYTLFIRFLILQFSHHVYANPSKNKLYNNVHFYNIVQFLYHNLYSFNPAKTLINKGIFNPIYMIAIKSIISLFQFCPYNGNQTDSQRNVQKFPVLNLLHILCPYNDKHNNPVFFYNTYEQIH